MSIFASSYLNEFVI